MEEGGIESSDLRQTKRGERRKATHTETTKAGIDKGTLSTRKRIKKKVDDGGVLILDYS